MTGAWCLSRKEKSGVHTIYVMEIPGTGVEAHTYWNYLRLSEPVQEKKKKKGAIRHLGDPEVQCLTVIPESVNMSTLKMPLQSAQPVRGSMAVYEKELGSSEARWKSPWKTWKGEENAN